MEPVAYVVIGLIAGWGAHLFFGPRGGLLGNIVAGIVGALVIFFIFRRVGIAVLPDFAGHLVKSAAGAIAFVVIWRSLFNS